MNQFSRGINSDLPLLQFRYYDLSMCIQQRNISVKSTYFLRWADRSHYNIHMDQSSLRLWTSAMIHVNHHCDIDVIGEDADQMTPVLTFRKSVYWGKSHLHGGMFKTQLNNCATYDACTQFEARVSLKSLSSYHEQPTSIHPKTQNRKQRWGHSDQLLDFRYAPSLCLTLWLDFTVQWYLTMCDNANNCQLKLLICLKWQKLLSAFKTALFELCVWITVA